MHAVVFFHRHVNVYQRIHPIKSHSTTIFLWFSYGFMEAHHQQPPSPRDTHLLKISSRSSRRDGDIKWCKRCMCAKRMMSFLQQQQQQQQQKQQKQQQQQQQTTKTTTKTTKTTKRATATAVNENVKGCYGVMPGVS